MKKERKNILDLLKNVNTISQLARYSYRAGIVKGAQMLKKEREEKNKN